MDFGITKSEAKSLSKNYQKLLGHRLNKDGHIYTVEFIAPAPFDGINQRIFITHYWHSKCPFQALDFNNYSGFDVLVIARNEQGDNIVYHPLTDF